MSIPIHTDMKIKKLCLSIICIGILFPLYAQENKFTLSGQISDLETGEDLISVTLYVPKLNIGTTSNEYGFYSITLDKGEHEITFSYIGYADQKLQIDMKADLKRNISMGEDAEVLKEVLVTAETGNEDENVTSTDMSKIDVKMESIKKLPALMGEVDVIKYIQTLPGVKTVGEGGSGFYVRGGNADQNLVLLDEAPIYNPSHLLGFFSSFNPDVIKDIQLYKGAIPAQYGGRLSSVLDIRMKEGNSKKFAAAGGIGSIFSRLAVEAPLGKKGSFILAGRRSYLDYMAKLYQEVIKGVKTDNDFYFYDLNAKTNFRLTEKDRFFASGYFGKDVFQSKQDGLGVNWGNKTGTFRWNHLFNPKLFSNLTYYYSNYDYGLEVVNSVSTVDWNSVLKEHSLKLDFGAYLNPNNTMKFGLNSIQHFIEPGNISVLEKDTSLFELALQENKSLESAFYISNEQKINGKLKVTYGLRLSMLNNIGPDKYITRDENYLAKDTVSHSKGIYNTYLNLEPRLGVRFNTGKSSSIKASYNRTVQYIQQASNGNTSTPFDIWFMSNENLKPQKVDQYAIGYFKNFKNNEFEVSLEAYYKDFKNTVDFKDHAVLLLNEDLDGELRFGVSRSYGLELLIKKEKGRLNGFIGYTLSKSEKKIETINNFEWYDTKYDKTHDLSIIANYTLNDRLSFGGSFVYSTGSAVTFPTGRYTYEGISVPYYSQRNGARLPDFHRLDLSLTLNPKKNKFRKNQAEWVLSIYNAYNRKNAFSINFKGEDFDPNQTYAEKVSVFSIVPSITYNFKF